jgi:xanthosine utilization system XapX-like protein
MSVRLLAVLPFIGILLGVPLVNRVEPLVLGMPFVLAWLVGWVVLSAIIMAIIYRCDPANRPAKAAGEDEVRS